MAEQSNGSSAATLIKGFTDALSKGIEKLTSDIFIFLLCYTILLIGMVVLGTKLPTELRALLYVLPVLGIGSYLWLRIQRLKAKAQTAKENLQADMEVRKMDSDDAKAKMQAEIDGLKALVVRAAGLVEGTVAAVAGGDNDSAEFLEAAKSLQVAVSAEAVGKGGAVGGIVFNKKDNLAKLAESLDEGTRNDLEKLIVHLQEIAKEGNDTGKKLRSIIRDMQELNEANLREVGKTVLTLRGNQ